MSEIFHAGIDSYTHCFYAAIHFFFLDIVLEIFYKNWHERAAFQRLSFGCFRLGGRLLAMT